MLRRSHRGSLSLLTPRPSGALRASSRPEHMVRRARSTSRLGEIRRAAHRLHRRWRRARSKNEALRRGRAAHGDRRCASEVFELRSSQFHGLPSATRNARVSFVEELSKSAPSFRKRKETAAPALVLRASPYRTSWACSRKLRGRYSRFLAGYFEGKMLMATSVTAGTTSRWSTTAGNRCAQPSGRGVVCQRYTRN